MKISSRRITFLPWLSALNLVLSFSFIYSLSTSSTLRSSRESFLSWRPCRRRSTAAKGMPCTLFKTRQTYSMWLYPFFLSLPGLQGAGTRSAESRECLLRCRYTAKARKWPIRRCPLNLKSPITSFAAPVYSQKEVLESKRKDSLLHRVHIPSSEIRRRLHFLHRGPLSCPKRRFDAHLLHNPYFSEKESSCPHSRQPMSNISESMFIPV